MIIPEEKITIYFADENTEFRKQVREIFKNAGINAKFISFNCEERLMSSLGQAINIPDLIFLTFNLDNQAALTCLRRIRIKKGLSYVPVIVFSPFTYIKDITEAFDNGASLFIPQSLFLAESQKTLQFIFNGKWRQRLLHPDRERFVLKTDDANAEKLILAHS